MKLFKPFEKKEKIDLVVVHIGKCGGSSVINELKKKGIRFFEKHVDQFKFRRKKKYILVIRNPISRFVSAYNWRYKLVVEDQTQDGLYKGERELIEKYGDVNNLAEHIFDENGTLVLDFRKEENYIHHIKEDIDFYIGELTKKAKKKNIFAVVATETLNEDLKYHFDIELTSHLKKNKKDTKLSPLALDNLIKYLHKDFECVERLNDLGVLNETQYKNLSSKSF